MSTTCICAACKNGHKLWFRVLAGPPMPLLALVFVVVDGPKEYLKGLRLWADWMKTGKPYVTHEDPNKL